MNQPAEAGGVMAKLPPRRDVLASVVVFLVALPLCMGIAIASGVPPALGLITGIVGGLVVGVLAGSPLQVSGPAAGLAVLVWELVQAEGVAVLGLVVLIAGGMQLAAGLLKLGRVFQAVSPAVIYGMLAGIGVILFGSQFHVMVDDKPRASVIENLMSIPVAVQKGIFPMDDSAHHLAAMVGITTIVVLVAWNNFRPKALKSLPGALMGVLAGTALAAAFGWPVAKVAVPDSLIGALNVPSLEVLGRVVEPGIWLSAAALALIASAETLLCATAVDAMHHGERTNYDRELAAQGVGNLLCGAAGALPMTGVIVRSSANVDAGATTRWSAFLHGAWLLLLVGLFPIILQQIPTASLAAILVYTGYKLVNIQNVKKLARFGRVEVAIYLATVVAIVTTDLLTGVGLGLALALGQLLWRVTHLDVRIIEDAPGHVVVELHGVASFVGLPRLTHALATVPPRSTVRVETADLRFVDQACAEQLESWKRLHEANGGTVEAPTTDELARFAKEPPGQRLAAR